MDSQVHIWEASSPARPWPAIGHTYAHRGGTPFSGEDVLAEMRRAAVEGAVLVPPSFAGDDNEVSIEAAVRFPAEFGVMGRISLDHPGPWKDLAGWREQPGMLGIRVTFSRRTATWLADGTADWFWSAAEREGVPVMVGAPGAPRSIERILRRHPDLRLAVDHLGLQTGSKVAPEAIQELVELAQYENCSVKASALPCYVDEPFPFPSAARLVRQVVDCFGPNRVFWGSDLSRLPVPYAECASYLGESGLFSGVELEEVMGKALCRWLAWSAGGRVVIE